MCCANQSRLKKSQNVILMERSQKWSVRKPKIPQPTDDMKDNKLPQNYMWAPLFPDYLLDIQTQSNQEMSPKLRLMQYRTFVPNQLSFVAFLVILKVFLGLNVSTFIKKNCKASFRKAHYNVFHYCINSSQKRSQSLSNE